MKFLYSLAALAVAGAAALSAQAEMVDVSAQYLKNYEFDGKGEYEFTSTNSDAINKIGQDGCPTSIPGWKMDKTDGGYKCYYTAKFGSNIAPRNVNHNAIPETNSVGESEDGGLVLGANWKEWVRVSQPVKLPAGKYSLKYAAYRIGDTRNQTQVDITTQYTGWHPTNGTAIVSGNKKYSVGNWVEDEISFLVTEETEGNICIGWTQPDTGDQQTPFVCFDYIRLYKDDSFDLNAMPLTIKVTNVWGDTMEGAELTFNKQISSITTDAEGVAHTTVKYADISDLVVSCNTDGYEVVNMNANWSSSEASKELNIVLHPVGNMMVSAISGYTNGSVPGEPWLAYNTNSNSVGGGNGWNLRNEAGAATATDPADQIFLRWNDGNSPWVYAYKVNLEADRYYKFHCYSTTNDGKANNLVIGFVKDMTNAKSNEVARFDISKHNSDVLYTDPVNCITTFATDEAGEYYIVFKTTNFGGNVITRCRDFVLVDAGAVDYEPIYTARAKELDAKVADINEQVFELMCQGEEATAFTEALYAENITDYKAALKSLNEAYDTMMAAVPSYSKFVNARELGAAVNGRGNEHADEADKSALAQALQFGYMGNEDVNAETVSAAADQIIASARRVAEDHAIALKKEGKVDIEDAIVNPHNPVNDHVSAWTMTQKEGYNAAINVDTKDSQLASHSEHSRYYDLVGGLWGANNWGGAIQQEISLEPGKYRLSVFARGSQDLDEFKLFAGDEETDLDHIADQGNLFDRGWNIHYVDFTVEPASETTTPELDETPGLRAETKTSVPVTIGVKAAASTNHQWLSFNQFRLVQLEKNAPTAVSEFEAAGAEAVYYDLNGMKVAGKMAPGVYVKRQGGETVKVLVK